MAETKSRPAGTTPCCRRRSAFRTKPLTEELRRRSLRTFDLVLTRSCTRILAGRRKL
jgi:hypothetical protein